MPGSTQIQKYWPLVIIQTVAIGQLLCAPVNSLALSAVQVPICLAPAPLGPLGALPGLGVEQALQPVQTPTIPLASLAVDQCTPLAVPLIGAQHPSQTLSQLLNFYVIMLSKDMWMCV